MIFILGFLAASLLASGFAPLFWNRALKLSARSLELRQPANLPEILAQRDAQAAGFAIDLCIEKQKTDFVTRERVKDLAKQGRLTRHLVALHERYAALEAQSLEQQAEIASLNDELNRLWAERGALEVALYDRYGLYERQVLENGGLKLTIGTLSVKCDDLTLALARSEKEKTHFYFQWQDSETCRQRLALELQKTGVPIEPSREDPGDEKIVPLDGSRAEKLVMRPPYGHKTRASR